MSLNLSKNNFPTPKKVFEKSAENLFCRIRNVLNEGKWELSIAEEYILGLNLLIKEIEKLGFTFEVVDHVTDYKKIKFYPTLQSLCK